MIGVAEIIITVPFEFLSICCLRESRLCVLRDGNRPHFLRDLVHQAIDFLYSNQLLLKHIISNIPNGVQHQIYKNNACLISSVKPVDIGKIYLHSSYIAPAQQQRK